MATKKPGVDLTPFCAIPADGTNLSSPFVVNGHEYATDGNIAVRVPARGIKNTVVRKVPARRIGRLFRKTDFSSCTRTIRVDPARYVATLWGHRFRVDYLTRMVKLPNLRVGEPVHVIGAGGCAMPFTFARYGRGLLMETFETEDDRNANR